MVSRPQPSSMVEYRGIAYSLGMVIEKLIREGTLSNDDPPSGMLKEIRDHPDRYPVASREATLGEGPCVCCKSQESVWGPGDWWPWDYTMGACLCVSCAARLLEAGVKALPWESGVNGVQTVKDGVRIAPEPDGKPHGYEEIVRLVGRPISPQEVVWANLGALTIWGKPLGDVIEGLWEAGKSLTPAEFERLVQRGKAA